MLSGPPSERVSGEMVAGGISGGGFVGGGVSVGGDDDDGGVCVGVLVTELPLSQALKTKLRLNTTARIIDAFFMKFCPLLDLF